MRNKASTLQYHLMLFPGMVLLFLFSIVPMFGVVIAFQDFVPSKGVFRSEWVGLDNLAYLFELPDSREIFANTLIIAVSKIVIGLLVPFLFALLLNEARVAWFKRSVQTLVYLPHFLSWVILALILRNLLSFEGIVNRLLGWFGAEPILFLGDNFWFRPIVVLSDVWKDFGFNTIIYLAAITAVNPSLYEAAEIDGAARLGKIRHVTIPGILPTVVLLATLSLGNVLNAGFDQVFNLYSPIVYDTGDIIDTYVYRAGLNQSQYGFATAVGLLKSAISFVLIVISYKLAAKVADYRIF